MEVTPLELKLSIEARRDNPAEKVDAEKENECCICFTELYDNLNSMSVQEVIEMQKTIFNAKVEKAASKKKDIKDADQNVVKLSKC